MRIDIGPEGRIVGTKRVSTGGQVAGLGSYAGKDVLVLVPEGRPQFSFSARDYLHDWEKLAMRGLERASKEIEGWRARVPTPEAVLSRARRELSPAALRARLPTPAEARRIARRQWVQLRKERPVRLAEKWVRSRLGVLDSRRRRSSA